MADDFPSLHRQHTGERFLTPIDLSVQAIKPRRVLIVGSCLAEVWRSRSIYPCDFVLINNLSQLPDHPPQPIEDYDFQLVQLPLRFIMPDAILWGLSFPDNTSHIKAFEESVQRLRQFLAMLLDWSARHKIVTFCANFLVPQYNPVGRFAPRYDFRNPVYFVEQLNVCLTENIKAYDNVFLLDIDQVSSVFGKRHIQDDAVQVLAHGALLSNAGNEPDIDRIEPIAQMTEHYDLVCADFVAAVWHEAASMYKTLHQEDAVKLVIVDLDNILWRGVISEGDDIDGLTIEGWPLGLVEALAYLKKRGIVLAIASQNEESKIRELWPQLLLGRFTLDDFAVVRINWNPKIDNIDEILRIVNVLPRHAVFIDDNPVERSRVQSVFPEMRVLGKYPYYLKRILLWSPELQVPIISAESSKRTGTIQAMALRESKRSDMSRDEFLTSLGIRVEAEDIASVEHAGFSRVFELINKTNQFNTTGKRWKREECVAYFEEGGVFYVVKVSDRFSDYGLVCCAMISENRIEQFIMSCRVIGLDVERTVISDIVERLRKVGAKHLHGHLIETKDNFPCRDLYRRNGFKQGGGLWTKILSADETVRDIG